MNVRYHTGTALAWRCSRSTAQAPLTPLAPYSAREVHGDREPSSHDGPLTATIGKSSDPIQSPRNSQRLANVRTVTNGRRQGPLGANGWLSAEACKCTLGPREATYIFEKLTEEQTKREQEEHASRIDALETRGRSRVRKW